MYYIGLDVGGTTFKAGIVNEQGTILHKDVMFVDSARTYVLYDDVSGKRSSQLLSSYL